jgi:hypothetical protein
MRLDGRAAAEYEKIAHFTVYAAQCYSTVGDGAKELSHLESYLAIISTALVNNTEERSAVERRVEELRAKR